MPCGWAGLVSETQMAQMVVMLGFTMGDKALWRGLGPNPMWSSWGNCVSGGSGESRQAPWPLVPGFTL